MKLTLEIGDVLYGEKRYATTTRHVIDRVTKTRAYAGSLVFFRDLHNNNLREYGSTGAAWHRYHYSLETPEHIERYAREQLLIEAGSAVKRIEMGKLANEELRKLIQLLSQYIR